MEKNITQTIKIGIKAEVYIKDKDMYKYSNEYSPRIYISDLLEDTVLPEGKYEVIITITK